MQSILCVVFETHVWINLDTEVTTRLGGNCGAIGFILVEAKFVDSLRGT